MNRTVSTNEGEHAAHDSDAEREALRVPTAHVDKRGEDFTSIAFGTKNEKRNEDGEESKDVKDQQSSFEFRKKPSSSDIDEDAEQDNGPVEQRDVPVLRDVRVRLAEDEQTLDQTTSQEAAGAQRSKPAAECQPSGNVTQKP